MFNKKRLITAAVLVVATITIVIVVGTIAGMLLFRSSSNTVAMPGATAVGIPDGSATTKRIGSEGGSIASPDGKIVVDVPPNAVTDPVDFSIQPITNLAHGGLGNAYRLEPGGHNFATTVKVSFKYDALDLKGTFPEAFALAYQDKTGVWQAFKTVNIDQASKTLTVSTTHFSDYSVVTYRLSPQTATLRVRENQYIELVGCRGEGNLLNRLRKLLGREDQQICFSSSAYKPTWSAQLGTIVPNGRGAIYTAPAKKPFPNIDRVFLTYEYVSDDSGQHSFGVFESEIKIVDHGYKATGQSHDLVYSGVVCDLEKPFDVNATGLANFTIKFVPSSPTKGTASYTTSYQMASEAGAGSYTVEGIDTDKPRIVWNVSGTARVRGYGKTASGTVYIDLALLDTDECSKK